MRIITGLTVLLLAAASPALAQTVQAGDVAFANSGAPGRAGALPHRPRPAARFRIPPPPTAPSSRPRPPIPNFAMAYWGEAMTYNHPVWMQQDAAAGPRRPGQARPDPRGARRQGRNPARARLSAAVEILYGDGDKAARDFRYADAMAALHARYPDDVDATAFDALALLGTTTTAATRPTYMKSAALLEEVYPTHLRHPGVLHYMIHSYDDPSTRRSACAPPAATAPSPPTRRTPCT